ncbi:MAG: hypothetical protein ACRCXC_11825 [Legionella sp.]
MGTLGRGAKKKGRCVLSWWKKPCEKILTQLPPDAKISVLLPGKPSPMHGIEHVKTETLRFFEGLSRHLRVTDEKKIPS